MTMTSFSPALVAEMRSWLADLTFVDLVSDDVLDASAVSDADVVDAVDRLYAGGVSAFVLAEDLAAAEGVSDAQLLEQLAMVLAGWPGPGLGAWLSTLIAHVCHAHVPAAAADERAELLTMRLAEYLHARHVLRESQVSPAGLNAWAAATVPVLVLIAVRACARSLGGGLR